MANDNILKQWLTSLNPYSRNSTDPNVVKKNLRNYIAPVQLQRFRQDIQTWRDVMMEAENAWFPHRVKAQRLYIDTANNGHVFSCMDRRKDLTLLRKWDFVNKNGKTDQRTSELFMDIVNGQSQNKDWFNRYLNFAIDSIFYGYSLITLGDIVNDEFPNIDIIKRWNVSPDRLNVTNFTYSLSGAMFLEEPYKDWHVYIKTYNDIGTSKSGYGLLYKVALYEIYLRDILGFNADFIELYAQPYRVGKTTKKGAEQEELRAAIQNMGSAGWALIDPEDEIMFLETALGGTGYKGYESFEERCEKKISKIILGHADALDSIPGKLGNEKEKSPAEKALMDKQTKDGSFIANCVNKGLMVNMRNLGFNIPSDTVAILKNDAEIMEMNNSIISQAVEMKKAGLQMSSDYFVEKTGIQVDLTSAPVNLTTSIKDKLNKIYAKHEH